MRSNAIAANIDVARVSADDENDQSKYAQLLWTQKSPIKIYRAYYMDGLVSTGNKFPPQY